MSNARSPREVCSTTIGTSGLIVLASFASSAGFLPNVATGMLRPDCFRRTSEASAAGRPQLPAPLLGSFLAGRPQRVACLRLLDRDGLRLPDQQLRGLVVGDLLTHPLQAIVLAQVLEQLLRSAARPLRRPAERLSHLLVAR